MTTENDWPEIVIALGQEIQRLKREIEELRRTYALDVGEEFPELQRREKYVN